MAIRVEKKPKQKAEKKKKVEYAAGVYPKQPLKDYEININGHTFDKNQLKEPDFIAKLPADQRAAILTSHDDIVRRREGAWDGKDIPDGQKLTDAQRIQAGQWSFANNELQESYKQNPSAFKELGTALSFLSPLAFAYVHGKDLAPYVSPAFALAKGVQKLGKEIGGGGKAGDEEGQSLTDFLERGIYTPEQEEALNSLIPELTTSLKQLHAEGREPMAKWQQIPWESLAGLAQAGTDYYTNSSALAQQYQGGEIPQLTASLEALGAPVNSSAYQNALQQSGQSYNDRLWALRSGAASQALKAIGSFGAHGRNLEDTRQKRFQQLADLSDQTSKYAFAPRTQALTREQLPPPPTFAQQAGSFLAEHGPDLIKTGFKALTGI